MTPIQREFFQQFLDTLPNPESVDIDNALLSTTAPMNTTPTSAPD
ncbi:hypothetical protein [Vibrio maritimus]